MLQCECVFYLECEVVVVVVVVGMLDVDVVDVCGFGLVVYSGNVVVLVGDSIKLILLCLFNSFINSYVIGGVGVVFYGNSEVVLSCFDLVIWINLVVVVGMFCIDESQVQLGSIYIWVLKQMGIGKIVWVFLYEVNVVLLFKVFVQVNVSNLFVIILVIVLVLVVVMNMVIVGVIGNVFDGVFSISYMLGSVYGVWLDNCNVGLFDVQGNYILCVEVNVVGQMMKCIFMIDGLNFGLFMKLVGQVVSGYVSVVILVLGNQVMIMWVLF